MSTTEPQPATPTEAAGSAGTTTADAVLADAGAEEALSRLPPGKNKNTPETSQATRLVELADNLFRVFYGADGRPYATLKSGQPAIAFPLRGKDGLRTRLARAFYQRHQQAAGGSALTDALTVLEGAAADADPEPVALRVGATATGASVLDLGTADGRAVIIDDGGWHIEDVSPLLFRRTTLTSALPTPRRAGSLDPLRELLNVSDAGFRLIVAWLLAALLPDIPHPILALTGEQGTAKSTTARMLVCLIDPSPAPLRTAPRDVKQWAVTAAASWTVALDNISTIPAWFSDTLCKAVTGDGIVDRALFTDDDVTVLSFRRAIALTSIDAGSLAGDLAERLLPVELHRIDADHRRPDAEISAAYDRARPIVLGGLLDLAVTVLAELPNVTLDQMPRMADFARVLAALDTATGWNTLTDYTTAAAEITESVIESDPFAEALRDFAYKQPQWHGTVKALHEGLSPDHQPRGWPKTPRAASGALRRLVPALRANGIHIDFDQQRSRNGSTLTIRTEPPHGPDET